MNGFSVPWNVIPSHLPMQQFAYRPYHMPLMVNNQMPMPMNDDEYRNNETNASLNYGNSNHLDDVERPLVNQSSNKPKSISPPIDIQGNGKDGEVDDRFIWTPPQQLMMDPRHLFSTGKHTIITDTNLSASTDDLLKLATGGNRSRGDSPVPSPKDNTIDLNQNNQINSDNKQSNEDAEVNGLKDSMSDLSLNSKSGQSVCRFHQSGYCRSGDRCPFSHGTSQAIELNNTPPPTPTLKTKTKLVINSASRYQDVSIEDCVGQIFDMCKDQHGCRFLQKQLDTRNEKSLKFIFDEVITNIVDLMSDPFGNYLCQKLLEHCSHEQRILIVRGVSCNLVYICKNMHGTRAVQKMIELLNQSDEIRIIRDSLKGSVVELIQDLNGNHVVQKCLHKMEPNDNQFIYDAVADNCVQVAKHKHGCCVMQRCIDFGTDDQIKQLIEEIRKNVNELVLDALEIMLSNMFWNLI
jgi:hypothetical protein